MANQTKKNGRSLNKKTKPKSRKQLEPHKIRKRKHVKIEEMEEVTDESLLGSLISSVGSYIQKLF